MATRSVGASDASNRVAALRTHTVSSISMSVSSNTTATKRWGKAAMAAAESPESFSSASSWGALVVASTLCDSGVSVLNVEITCGLRLSESWKSSFLRLGTICPLLSRTTTRTKTRFTRTRNVGGVSRVETSEASFAGAVAEGALVAGACVSDLAGTSCAWAWQAAQAAANSAPKRRAYVRRVSGNRNEFRILPFVASPYFLLRKCTPRRVTQQRLVARLYASVKISVNESRNGSRGTASGLPTFRQLSVGQKPDPGKHLPLGR